LLSLFPLLIPGNFHDLFALAVIGFSGEIKGEPLMMKKKNQQWRNKKITSGKSSADVLMKIKIVF
jgi:hypothetical protein